MVDDHPGDGSQARLPPDDPDDPYPRPRRGRPFEEGDLVVRRGRSRLGKIMGFDGHYAVVRWEDRQQEAVDPNLLKHAG